MKPLRMCSVCRERKEKTELIRIVKSPEGKISVDIIGKAPGRGAYICKNEKCVKTVQKRRALERTFSAQVPQSVYEELFRLIKQTGGTADES